MLTTRADRPTEAPAAEADGVQHDGPSLTRTEEEIRVARELKAQYERDAATASNAHARRRALYNATDVVLRQGDKSLIDMHAASGRSSESALQTVLEFMNNPRKLNNVGDSPAIALMALVMGMNFKLRFVYENPKMDCPMHFLWDSNVVTRLYIGASSDLEDQEKVSLLPSQHRDHLQLVNSGDQSGRVVARDCSPTIATPMAKHPYFNRLPAGAATIETWSRLATLYADVLHVCVDRNPRFVTPRKDGHDSYAMKLHDHRALMMHRFKEYAHFNTFEEYERDRRSRLEDLDAPRWDDSAELKYPALYQAHREKSAQAHAALQYDMLKTLSGRPDANAATKGQREKAAAKDKGAAAAKAKDATEAYAAFRAKHSDKKQKNKAGKTLGVCLVAAWKGECTRTLAGDTCSATGSDDRVHSCPAHATAHTRDDTNGRCKHCKC